MKSTRQGRSKPAGNASRIRRNRPRRDDAPSRNPRSATAKRRTARRGSYHRTLFEHLRQGAFYQRADGVLLDVNPAALELFGLTRNEFLRRTFEAPEWKVIREDGSPFPGTEYPSAVALRTGRTVRNVIAGVFNPRRNDCVWMEINAIPGFRRGTRKPFQVLVTLQDITERKRADTRRRQDAQRTELLLDLHQRASHMTDRALYDYVLEKAVALTDSAIGFFHQVSEDQKSIILTTWNQAALQNCTAEFDTHYSLGEAGNWVDCVRQQRPIIYNDFAHSPNQRGLPPGHAPVRRFMSIPVIDGGKVRIIFGVGNKVEDYDDRDVAQLQLVANELHNIMAQRHAQERLRLQALLLDQIADTVTATDLEGRITYVNAAQARAMGRSRTELIGQSVVQFGDDPARGANQREIIAATRQQGSWRGEVINRDATGREFTVEARTALVRDERGQPIGMIGVGTNITERKRADEALRRSEERYRRIVETAREGVWVMDRWHHTTFVNDQMARMLGYEPGEIIGRAVEDFMFAEDLPAHKERMAHRHQGQSAAYENRFRRPDGSELWTIVSATALTDTAGQFDGSFAMFTDITERKQAEAVLRESEEFRRAIFDSMAAHIAVVSQAGVIVSVNAPWERFRNENPPVAGSPTGKCDLGADYLEVCRCSAQQGAEGAMNAGDGIRSVLSGQAASFTMEYPCHGPTEQRWFSMMVTRLGSGQRGAVVSHTNITELKQAEQALAASKARLEALFRAVPTGVGMVVNRVLQEVNERILEMTGYSREELIGVNARVLYPTEEDFLYVGREKYRQIGERGTGTVESRWRRKDGAIRDVLLSSTPLDPADHSRGVVFTALDITEWIRSEAMVRKLSQAVEQSPVSVVITDLKGNIEYVNRRFCEITGYGRGEILGRNPRLLQSGQTSREAYRQLWSTITQGGEWDGEMLNRKKNGELFWERALISPVQDAHGRTTHYLGIKEDITERKHTEAELRASREQLRALASSLTRAEHRERRRIATLLHDDVIQSLALTRIKLGALRAHLAAADQQSLFDSIRTHLEGAISSTRSMTFQLSPPILHELGLEAALGWLAEQFTNEHGVHCEFVADAAPVSLDEETRNLLFIAARELLVNVVKHARATCARVSTQTDGGSLRVIVEDDGAGCHPDSMPVPSVKTGGFGLFSIRERLTYLGGHCEVQSTPARGTRVTLTMPLNQT